MWSSSYIVLLLPISIISLLLIHIFLYYIYSMHTFYIFLFSFWKWNGVTFYSKEQEQGKVRGPSTKSAGSHSWGFKKIGFGFGSLLD